MPENNQQKNLIVEEEAGLVTITMNRPEKRNALSTAMMSELNAQLRSVGGRRDARAVMIAGNGPAFSAGHDLSELKARDPTRDPKNELNAGLAPRAPGRAQPCTRCKK